MKLAGILGYQLDMARCAALRSVRRLLADEPFRPADTTALLLVRDRPGCNQTTLGRILSGNRSVGMKVASRLEAEGLLTRGTGRDRRSKGLFITPEGERVLEALLARHARAEARLATYLTPDERKQLLTLLGKVRRAIEEEEAELQRSPERAADTARVSNAMEV
ncbi:MAG TPA: MarR family transcriptional regulator [Sphingomonadaceae bacterium]|nr:MarR family transcriptional regulator [Sphingomonadaceae bacterium]